MDDIVKGTQIRDRPDALPPAAWPTASGEPPVATGIARRETRPRRSRDEVRALIVAAARAVFAEHGFAGATTREIADRADASEVLIFRYFASKAGLFEETILAPFNRLIGDFIELHHDDLPDRQRGNEVFVGSFYPFLKANADLLQALVKSRMDSSGEGSFRGLDDYFARATERLRVQYAREDVRAEIAPELSVRFGFGMLAAAILFHGWFFHDGGPDDGEITHALSRMLYKALSPAQPDPAP
jgi:AcrR family transcriptional regulator